VLGEPLQISGTEISTSASIGITFSTIGYQLPEEVLRDADIAMYRAKAAGKARHALFDAGLHQQVTDRVRLEGELRRAVEAGHLSVAYQPLFNLASGKLTGFEALARWQHPVQGLISPAVFIPIAEETALIGPLTDFVLDSACRQLKLWQSRSAAFAGLSIQVNVSGNDIAHSAFAQRVTRAIVAARLQPNHLTLELTENVLMDRVDGAVDTLTRLRDLGVGLSIDDFGTGYSSLSYLSTLPIDSLKIDASFVRGMRNGSKEAEVVRAIVTLGASLGKSVIAEGIETESQFDQLRGMGCESGQGYHLSRPLAVENVELLLDRIETERWTVQHGQAPARCCTTATLSAAQFAARRHARDHRCVTERASRQARARQERAQLIDRALHQPRVHRVADVRQHVGRHVRHRARPGAAPPRSPALAAPPAAMPCSRCTQVSCGAWAGSVAWRPENASTRPASAGSACTASSAMMAPCEKPISAVRGQSIAKRICSARTVATNCGSAAATRAGRFSSSMPRIENHWRPLPPGAASKSSGASMHSTAACGYSCARRIASGAMPSAFAPTPWKRRNSRSGSPLSGRRARTEVLMATSFRSRQCLASAACGRALSVNAAPEAAECLGTARIGTRSRHWGVAAPQPRCGGCRQHTWPAGHGVSNLRFGKTFDHTASASGRGGRAVMWLPSGPENHLGSIPRLDRHRRPG
jgi:EAL domain-containing protein (putative c-di-GMP-specific phosphodiesterase class I)